MRVPESYRLVSRSPTIILVPPKVAGPDVAQRSFKTAIVSGRRPCPTSEGAVRAERHGKTLHLAVNRDLLATRPPGWLNRWSAVAESQGCIVPGEAANLADSILESVPLDPAVAFRLLHEGTARTGFQDLGPTDFLQVNSPILREGASPDAPQVESSTTNGLTVEAKLNSSVIGFETATFAVRPKERGIGFRIVPRSAVRNIGGVAETADAPSANYLEFPPEAAFYRLFYKFWDEENAAQTIIVMAGSNRAELESLTREVAADPAVCDKSPRALCRVMPRRIGLNPMTMVTVNGREIMLPLSATVADAIRAAGERKPESALPQLAVRKLYRGKLAPLEFDRSTPVILRLMLAGGEDISWPR